MPDDGRRLYLDTYLATGTVGAVAATDGSNSAIIDLSGPEALDGVIRGLKVSAPDSTNYNVYVFTKADGSNDSIYEVIKITGINKSHISDDFYVVFLNRDVPQQKRLYLTVLNYGDAIPEVNWEVTFNLHRRKQSRGQL